MEKDKMKAKGGRLKQKAWQNKTGYKNVSY